MGTSTLDQPRSAGPPGTPGQPSGAGSFWSVPGLGDDVGTLLGDPTGGKGAPPRRRPSPTVDARVYVRDNASLGASVRGCRAALGGARRSLQSAPNGAERDARVTAWLALMDELLLLGERMTERLLGLPRS
ncbi:MAG TPA: hypothetical protein VFC93_19665 [Chloroflexota bacterium]|nr:hypothetical protein [Chloroflexota bacterium]